MNFPHHGGGGFMPPQNFAPQQPAGYLPAGYYPPTTWHAINALTPGLFRAASEQHTIFGSTHEAILANLLGAVSFASSGNFRIRGHNGKAMPLTLHIRFVGPPLSGKSDARDRFNAPIIEAMKGWKKSWKFANVTPPTLMRKIHGGSVLSMLCMAEGRGHLGNQVAGQLSCAFEALSDLYDANVPPFDRSDDDDEVVANAPDSVIFVTCVNVQNDAHRGWLVKHVRDAIVSGYLYRLLILETHQIAMEGTGNWQPESALLDYDQRMTELIASARLNVEAISSGTLPVLEISPEAEQTLRQALEHFRYMASVVLPPKDAHVFAVRLSANMRRIAGGMHVHERYQGAVTDDTMARAAIIAEYLGACWLATVFPPKSIPIEVQWGWQLLDFLYCQASQSGMHEASFRKSDVMVWAPNFDWTTAEMEAAIKSICGQGLARVVARTENGRRVVKLELVTARATLQAPNQIGSFGISLIEPSLPQDELDARIVLPLVQSELGNRGAKGVPQDEIVTLAQNLKLSPTRTRAALRVLYSSGYFLLLPHSVGGRIVEMIAPPIWNSNPPTLA